MRNKGGLLWTSCLPQNYFIMKPHRNLAWWGFSVCLLFADMKVVAGIEYLRNGAECLKKWADQTEVESRYALIDLLGFARRITNFKLCNYCRDKYCHKKIAKQSLSSNPVLNFLNG